MKDLFVLTVYKNLMDLSRYAKYMRKNYYNFSIHVENSGAILYTAEIDVGKGFVVTHSRATNHLQLRASCPEIWNRDCAFNLLLKRLPSSAEYVAYTDSDIMFCNPNWVNETIDLLQKYPAIQMWSHTRDLDAEYMPDQDETVYKSWAYDYVHNLPTFKPDKFTGMAWAFRREVLEKVPMIDWIISGQSDTEFCLAAIGMSRLGSTAAYDRRYLHWADKVYDVVNGKVNYVPGLLIHHFHGPRNKRGYEAIRNILVNSRFDPDRDIEYDDNGLYRFTGVNTILEKAMHDWYYNREDITK